jgi:hypothetical protein
MSVKCTLQSKLRELLMQHGVVQEIYNIKYVQKLMHNIICVQTTSLEITGKSEKLE